MNEFQPKNAESVQTILAKYPPEQRRSAVMPLLTLAQQERGYLTLRDMVDIGGVLDMSVTDVASVVGFYTLYHAESGSRYHLQVCTDLPCALRGADAFLEDLCRALGVRPGESTPDGLFTIEEVTCLAGCHRAPLFQVQGDGSQVFHENQTVETALGVVEELRRRVEQERGVQA